VANTTTASAQLGVTPAKLKLIGLLAAILVVVLYIQYGRSGADVAPAAPESRSPRTSKRANKPARQVPNVSEQAPSIQPVDLAAWKTPELESVIRYNPFALPATFPQPKPTIVETPSSGITAAVAAQSALDEQDRLNAVQDMQVELETLKRQGVQVILTKDDQFVAMIGQKIYHVGDEIGGFKITAIDDNGVHVERAIQQ